MAQSKKICRKGRVEEELERWFKEEYRSLNAQEESAGSISGAEPAEFHYRADHAG